MKDIESIKNIIRSYNNVTTLEDICKMAVKEAQECCGYIENEYAKVPPTKAYKRRMVKTFNKIKEYIDVNKCLVLTNHETYKCDEDCVPFYCVRYNVYFNCREVKGVTFMEVNTSHKTCGKGRQYMKRRYQSFEKMQEDLAFYGVCDRVASKVAVKIANTGLGS